MTIIGDAVAGANFEGSEPLARHHLVEIGTVGTELRA
jgi:hypothetical protein